MAGDHDRLAHSLKLFQDLAHLDAGTRVETRGRLIQEQYRRVVDQRPGEAEALLQASRQCIDRLVTPVGETDQLEQVGRDFLTPGSRNPVASGVEIQVFGGRQLIVDTEEVRHIAQSIVHQVRMLDDVGPVHECPAAGRLEQRSQDP